jgi:hypothetical protein
MGPRAAHLGMPGLEKTPTVAAARPGASHATLTLMVSPAQVTHVFGLSTRHAMRSQQVSGRAWQVGGGRQLVVESAAARQPQTPGGQGRGPLAAGCSKLFKQPGSHHSSVRRRARTASGGSALGSHDACDAPCAETTLAASRASARRAKACILLIPVALVGRGGRVGEWQGRGGWVRTCVWASGTGPFAQPPPLADRDELSARKQATHLIVAKVKPPGALRGARVNRAQGARGHPGTEETTMCTPSDYLGMAGRLNGHARFRAGHWEVSLGGRELPLTL